MLLKPWSFFLKIKKIPSPNSFFLDLEEKVLKYHYFQIDSTYYLFLVGTTNSEEVLELCYKKLEILEELNKKQRKIRSLRGFFLYVSEILETGEDKNLKVIKTNFSPVFWKRVKEVIRQNQKGDLTALLFETSPCDVLYPDLIQTIQTQLNGLQNTIEILASSIEANEKLKSQGSRCCLEDSRNAIGEKKQSQKVRTSAYN